MSRTYKYPRTHLSGSIERVEDVAQKRIRKKLEIQKRLRKKRAKKTRSFIKVISFRDKQRARF